MSKARNSSQTPGSQGAPQRPRDEIKRILEDAFRREFPSDTVDVSDGFRDNIHVLIVSRRFDRMSEPEKQDLLWSVVDSTDLNDVEKSLLSLLLPRSPAELK